MASTATGSPRRWVATAAFLAVSAAAMLACGSGGEGEGGGAAAPAPVAFEGRDDVGDDPFTASVASTTPADFPDAVVAAADATVEGAAADEATGGVTTTGATPGLYGGTGEASACDVEALVGYLDDPANADKATAFAGVLGIDPAAIADTLATFTPVVLTVDTFVTNHGFRDGRARAFPAVLEAGTAVLVDPTGTPRVKCGCGNPLAPPPTDVELPASSDDAWDGYGPASTVSVTPSPAPLDTITVTDTETGEQLPVPAGEGAADPGSSGGTSSLPAMLARIALGNGDFYAVDLLASEDGTEWERVHTFAAGQTIEDLAIGDDLAVAVGRDEAGQGLTHTSADAATWDGPHPTPVPFGDVAFLDGAWFAVTQDVAATEPDVYRSADGVTWEQVATVPVAGDGFGTSITGTPDGLVVTSWSGQTSTTSTSPDGTTWTAGTPVPVAQLQVAHDGTSFGAVGTTQGAPSPVPQSLSSDDGLTWSAPTPIDTTSDGPDDLDRAPEGLAAFDGGWIAYDTICPDLESLCDFAKQIITSTDLTSWTGLAVIDGWIEGLAVAP